MRYPSPSSPEKHHLGLLYILYTAPYFERYLYNVLHDENSVELHHNLLGKTQEHQDCRNFHLIQHYLQALYKAEAPSETLISLKDIAMLPHNRSRCDYKPLLYHAHNYLKALILKIS